MYKNARLKMKVYNTFENVNRTGILIVFGQAVPKIGCCKEEDTPTIRF